jgi:hypothetical protein
LLIDALVGNPGVTPMPYKKPPLAKEQISLIRAWIDQGAPAPAGEQPDDGTGGHWAFRRPVRPPLPAVKDHAWARNLIDLFILARLEQAGIKPNTVR